MSMRLLPILILAHFACAAPDGGSSKDASGADIAVDALDILEDLDAGQNDVPVDNDTAPDLQVEPDVVTPEDAGESDEGLVEVVEDVAGAPDAPVEDTIEEAIAPSDVVEEDGGDDLDIAEPDVGVDVADVGDDVTDAGSVPNACDPTGKWTLTVESAALPGEGCGKDGDQAQSPDDHVFLMEVGPGGEVTVEMLGKPDPSSEVTVEVIGGPTGCELAITVSASVYVPAGGGAEGGTIHIDYVYDVVELDGVVTGSGTVTTKFVTDSDVVLNECPEPISVSGTFVGEKPGNVTYTLDVSKVISFESGVPVEGNLIISHNAVAGFPIDLSTTEKVIGKLGADSVFEAQTLSGCFGNAMEEGPEAINWGDSGLLHLQPGHPLLTNLDANDNFDPPEQAHVLSVTAVMPYKVSQNDFTYVPDQMCYGVRVPGLGWLWSFEPVMPTNNDFIELGGVTFQLGIEDVDMVGILVNTTTGFDTISYTVAP